MKNIIHKTQIPTHVSRVTDTLEKAGFEAWIVGGCVRDLVLGRNPKDWDVTTNASPEQIQTLFPKTVYENKFGTVAVVWEDEPADSPFRIIEVTPFRKDGEYSDHRHPDHVTFADSIDEDLARRDFTMNALAYRPSIQSPGIQADALNDIDDANVVYIKDNYGGLSDIQRQVITTVGVAEKRFKEDALRMMRAVRLSSELGFTVSRETSDAIVSCGTLISQVSAERIRDEFVKIVNAQNSSMGIGFLVKLGLMKHIIPELEEGVGCIQGGVHIYDVFEHLLHALQHASDKEYPFHVKLAALFHDIGKPRSRRPGKKKAYTFYGHEVIGARMVKDIMSRLKFPLSDIQLVVKLVRWHMFFSDTEQISLSAVRRMVANVSSEHIWDLMKTRECDRVGMKKKETPYRLRKYHAMIEEVLRDPISVSQLKIDGTYLIKELHMKPGPRMGWILHALLEEVLEDPSKNTVEGLVTRVTSLDKLSDSELRKLGEAGKRAKEEADDVEIEKLKEKHGVK